MNDNKHRLWRIVAHHAAAPQALQWSKRHSQIAVGWGRIGRASAYRYIEDVNKAIAMYYPNEGNHGGPSLMNFLDMKQGDFVVLIDPKGTRLPFEVDGDYEFVERPRVLGGHQDDYYHRRKVRPVRVGGALLVDASDRIRPGQNLRWTVALCAPDYLGGV